MAACSLSYLNALLGTPVTKTGTGTSLSDSIAAAPGQRMVQVFNAITNSTISGYTQTQRYNGSYSSQGGAQAMVVGDAPGAATVNFAATNNAADKYVSMIVPLL